MTSFNVDLMKKKMTAAVTGSGQSGHGSNQQVSITKTHIYWQNLKKNYQMIDLDHRSQDYLFGSINDHYDRFMTDFV